MSIFFPQVLRPCKLHTPWLAEDRVRDKRHRPLAELRIPGQQCRWDGAGDINDPGHSPFLCFITAHVPESLPSFPNSFCIYCGWCFPEWLTIESGNLSFQARRKMRSRLVQIEGAEQASQLAQGQGKQSGEWKGNMQNYLENLLLTTLFCWQQRYETGTKELKKWRKTGWDHIERQEGRSL